MDSSSAAALLESYGYLEPRITDSPFTGYEVFQLDIPVLTKRLISGKKISQDIDRIHRRHELGGDLCTSIGPTGVEVELFIGQARPEFNHPLSDNPSLGNEAADEATLLCLERAIYAEQFMLYRWIYGDDSA